MFGLVLVADFDDDLRVIQLLLLRRYREPESWTAAADKCRQRSEHRGFFPRLVGVLRGVSTDRFSDHCFRMSRGFVGSVQRRIFWKPYVHVGKIRKVLGKELRLQLTHEESTKREKRERAGQYFPSMVYCRSPDSIVKGREALLTTLFDRRLLLWLDHVKAKQRQERH